MQRRYLRDNTAKLGGDCEPSGECGFAKTGGDWPTTTTVGGPNKGFNGPL